MTSVGLTQAQNTKSLEEQLSDLLAKYASAQAEIFVLSRKVDTLSTNTTEQISEFKHQELRCQCEFNQKEEEYLNKIICLEQQLQKQSIKLQNILLAKEELEVKLQQNICTIHELEDKTFHQAQSISDLTKLNQYLSLQVISYIHI